MQSDVSYTRKYGGTGLGLSITPSLVEAMGGELRVESVPKIGTMFSFTFTFKSIHAPEGKFFNEPILGHTPKPLKVGLTVFMASNGLEGLEKVKERRANNRKPFDLIFMDIHMPVMDGLEAAAIIGKLNTGTPIVAMTANVMVSDQETYKASGMKETVSKPFTTQVLWRCLLRYFTTVNWLNEDVARVRAEEEKFKLRMMAQFIDNNRDICKEIESAIASDEIVHAYRLAHNLMARKHLPDLILLDIIIRDMNGYTVLYEGSTFTVCVPQKTIGPDILGKKLVNDLQNFDMTQSHQRRLQRLHANRCLMAGCWLSMMWR